MFDSWIGTAAELLQVLAQNASIKLLDPVVEHMMTDVMQAMQVSSDVVHWMRVPP